LITSPLSMVIMTVINRALASIVQSFIPGLGFPGLMTSSDTSQFFISAAKGIY
jgi:hypothetical protein